MPNWLDTLVPGLRSLARQLQAHLPGQSMRPGIKPFHQPLRIIPGMPAASEPCLLPERWSAAHHPHDAHYQWKIDGMRALYVDTTIVSREAIPLDCALHCLPALYDLEQHYGRKMVFDGEYQARDGFQATLAEHKRGEGSGIFWIFDAVPYDEWAANRFSMVPLAARMSELQHRLADLKPQFVQPLALLRCPSPAQALEDSYRRGLVDGIVIKDPRSPYARGRGRSWLKMKPHVTIDAQVKDMVIKDGRVTALIVGWLEGGQPRSAKIGSFSSLAIPAGTVIPQLQGAIVEIGFNDTTDAGKPKGAHLIRFRDDKKEPDNV